MKVGATSGLILLPNYWRGKILTITWYFSVRLFAFQFDISFLTKRLISFLLPKKNTAAYYSWKGVHYFSSLTDYSALVERPPQLMLAVMDKFVYFTPDGLFLFEFAISRYRWTVFKWRFENYDLGRRQTSGADPEILKGEGAPYRLSFQRGVHHSDSGV